MILSKTPFRITFFGGGSDFPEYFMNKGGATLGSSINKYAYVLVKSLSTLDPYSYRLSYSASELCKEVDEIKHPVIKSIIKYKEIDKKFELHYFADLPSLSGLGTSSAFTIGCLSSLNKYMDINTNKTKLDLAKEAIKIEREILKESGGYQDQYTCGVGGLLSIKYNIGGEIVIDNPIINSIKILKLQSNLLLFYTGATRNGTTLLQEQLITTLNGFNDKYLQKMSDMVDVGVQILKSENSFDNFGRLIHESWTLKKQLSRYVTNDYIDNIYNSAIENGALGGKLLGAGSGGFMLFYVPKPKQAAVIKALLKLKLIPFEFETNGTQLVTI